MITFQYESYGTYARSSYCADYLELLALLGAAPHWGDYDDFLSGARVPLKEAFRGAFIEPMPGELVGRPINFVRNTLDERAAVLGDRYPFVLSDRRLELKPGWEDDTYLGLLSLLQLHVIEDAQVVRSELAFEISVRDSMRSAGLLAETVGTSSGAGFRASLEQACTQLNLVANPDGVAHPKLARDEDVDTICRFNFSDVRRGQWLLVGQATCAKSDEWQHKAKEPSSGAWATYTSCSPKPRVFLAVPHHVQSDTLAFLLGHLDEGFVVDRLRLTAIRQAPTAEEQTAIDRVRQLGVEWA